MWSSSQYDRAMQEVSSMPFGVSNSNVIFGRRLAPIVAAAMLIVAGSGPAFAQEELQIRSDIQAAYDRMAGAFIRKDMAEIASFYTADARLVDVDGLESGPATAMAEFEANVRQFKELGVRITVDSVSLQGDQAVAMARLSFSGSVDAQSLLRMEVTSRDSWTKLAAGWRIRRQITLREMAWRNDMLVHDRSYDPPASVAESALLAREIAAQAKPFNSVDAGSGFDDLAALDPIIGDARIVALGEASHGTAEFFRMKHRLLEYLVEKKGFTVFALETIWPDTAVVDRYIKAAGGDAAGAVRVMNHPWHTKEIQAMVQWMADYNRTRGDRAPISFSGFDAEPEAKSARKCAVEFFGRLGSTERTEITQLYQGLDQIDSASAAEKKQQLVQAAKALELFDARREALVKGAAPSEYTFARQCARIVHQVAELSLASAVDAPLVRDRMMAENARWLIEEAYPNQKIVLSAHNAHVATAPVMGYRPMGSYLREAFGRQMVVLALAFERGTVRAAGKEDQRDYRSMNVDPPLPSGVEALLARAGLPRFMLDFRRVDPRSAFGAWLAKSHPHRVLGWVINPAADYNRGVTLPTTYDAMIFIAESSAAKPLDR